MRNAKDSVCLRHTDRPAVTRCETCFRPLCEECRIPRDNVDFCSEQCAIGYTDTQKRMEAFEKQTRRVKGRRLRRLLLRWLIVAAIAGGIYYWCRAHPAQARRWWQTIRNTVGLSSRRLPTRPLR